MTDSPLFTALLASNSDYNITFGLEVLILEVIAAITTVPYVS